MPNLPMDHLDDSASESVSTSVQYRILMRRETYCETMTDAGNYLHVELLFVVRQNLHGPSALLRHEERILVWRDNINRRYSTAKSVSSPQRLYCYTHQ